MHENAAVNATSFTDDTSLQFVPFVSIHAQIMRDQRDDLHWFHLLRELCSRAENGEFKKAAIEALFAQSVFVQMSLIRSIGMARIHITDPRPHVAGMGEFLRAVLPTGTDLMAFIKKLETGNAYLSFVRESLTDYVAETMLRRSPAQRLLMTQRAFEYSHGLRINPKLVPKDLRDFVIDEPDPLPIDLDPFRRRKANLLRGVSHFVSASASVFTPAIDELTGDTDKHYATSPEATRWGAAGTLCKSHAFDKGDSTKTTWMEEQRAEVLERTRHPFSSFEPVPLVELESADSENVQAADIAAGIARELWFRYSLVHVVRHFRYVTYNSDRLSVDKAASIQKFIQEEL